MRYLILSFCLILSISFVFAQSKRIVFETEYGSFKVQLYDFTPRHRDLILQAVRDSVYQGALFNRVIKDFVVQGGEHDMDIENREKEDVNQNKPRLAGEFDDRAFHKIGALGAGRDDNPEKASFLNQIYFVVGKVITISDLDKLEIKMGYSFTDVQRAEYLKNGGLPRLDQDYTVFGEIYEGLDVIMKISGVQTDTLDFPLVPISFKISIIE